MIKSILGTVGSRFIVMFLTFLVVYLNTNFLGFEGQGTAALIQFGVLIIVSLSNYIGGGSIVYVLPREKIENIIIPGYLWAISSSIILTGIFFLITLLPFDIQLVPKGFVLQVGILGVIQALFVFHLQLLMGQKKIKHYNIVVTIQALVLFLALAYQFLILKNVSIDAFVIALFASFSSAYILSFIFSMRGLRLNEISNKASVWKFIFNYGKYSQSGNVLQIFNYRLNLFLLESILGASSRGQVGMYSIGLYASEAVWNFSKSLSIIQYSHISNSDDQNHNRNYTIKFLQLSLWLTCSLVIIMLLIPDALYEMIFGTYEGWSLHNLLAILAPGMIFNSLSVIFSHYFSGTGKPNMNMWSSGIGLVLGLIFGLILIPKFYLTGAAIAASIAYLGQLLFLWKAFSKERKITLSELVPTKSKAKEIKELMKD